MPDFMKLLSKIVSVCLTYICGYVCMHICFVFPHPRKQIVMALSCKGYTKPVVHLHAGKLSLEDGFCFLVMYCSMHDIFVI